MSRELHAAPEELFWYWMAERHRIFLKRQAGLPKPWTEDEILRDYKFTNPFRENDRGTVWLRENFLEPHRDDNLGLIAFNICWYRMFNWWGTGALLGWQEGWNVPYVKQVLERNLAQGMQVFTGAHIVYSPPGLGKVEAIVDVCADLHHMCVHAGALETCCEEENSLQVVFEALQEVHCVGGFMAYEMVTDMRHTRLLENAKDIMTWANMGPGAQRGLRRLGLPAKNQKEGCESMRHLLSHAPGSGFAPFFDSLSDIQYPVIEMRDIEHSLCEFDKYCRVKFGEGAPRGRFNGRAE
jgi:hypothetical protein